MLLLRRSCLVALSLFALLLLAACASSPQHELAKGKSEYLQNRYTLSYTHIQKAAEAGDPDAQYALGYMYYYGKGIPQDMTKAKYWISQAAANGQPLANQALQRLGLASPTPPLAPKPLVASKAKAVPKVKAAPKKVVRKIKAVVSTGHTASERYLLSRPRTTHTIQLAGTYYQKNAHYYIKHHRLDHKACCYRTYHNGKRWYVVVYGVYPSRSAALKAFHSLPHSVTRAKPWIKTLARVQNEIRKIS